MSDAIQFWTLPAGETIRPQPDVCMLGFTILSLWDIEVPQKMKSAFGRRFSLNYKAPPTPLETVTPLPDHAPVKSTFGRRFSLTCNTPTQTAPRVDISNATKSTFGRRFSLNYAAPTKQRDFVITNDGAPNEAPPVKSTFGRRFSLNYQAPAHTTGPGPRHVPNEAPPIKSTFGRRFSLTYNKAPVQPTGPPQVPNQAPPMKSTFGRRLSLNYRLPIQKKHETVSSRPIPIEVPEEGMKKKSGRRFSLSTTLPIMKKAAPPTNRSDPQEKKGAIAPLSANEEQQLARATEFFKSLQLQKLDRFDKYIAPDAVYYFKGQDIELLYHEALEVYRGLFASFPDHMMAYESISVVPGEDTVVLQHVKAKMTHTGAPFNYMEPFPALPPSGKCVENGPMDCYYHFDTGGTMIHRVVIDAHAGVSVGPPAIYTQLGGLIF